MKCVCRYEFKPGDIIHQIYGKAPQLLCDKCYAFYVKTESTDRNVTGILIKNLIMARNVIDEIWCDDDDTL